MSAIFKTRKTPKHLIIRDDDYQGRNKSRFSLFKTLLWLSVLVLLTGVVLMLPQFTAGVS